MKKDQAANTPRPLTEKEQKRAEKVAAVIAGLEEKGYRRHDLTISINKANIYALLWVLPFCVVFIGLYFLLGWNPISGLTDNPDRMRTGCLLLSLLFFVLIPVHEAIHGVTWAAFAPSHFKSIEYGVIWKMLTPYCTCLEPLSKAAYVTGSFMPCLLLGIVPCVVSLCTGSLFWLVIGLLMIMGAGGDLTIIAKLLSFPDGEKQIIYLDHPTECGLIAMVRD